MSTRLSNLLVLALVTGVAAGCASGGTGAAESAGFLQGMVDGFLILVEFLAGRLEGAGHLADLQMNTSYGIGYIAGAASFLGLGTAFSAA